MLGARTKVLWSFILKSHTFTCFLSDGTENPGEICSAFSVALLLVGQAPVAFSSLKQFLQAPELVIAVLDRVREFYFGKKNKLVMELREGKENSFSCFRFGSCWWLCRFACSDGYCQNSGKNKAKMASSPRKICTIVGRLGGSGERELGSRCLWSEPQSLQSVCFLALKYFFFLPPCFTESWGGSFLLLF